MKLINQFCYFINLKNETIEWRLSGLKSRLISAIYVLGWRLYKFWWKLIVGVTYFALEKFYEDDW